MKRLFGVVVTIWFVASCSSTAKVDLSVGRAKPPIKVEVTDNEYTPVLADVVAGQTIVFTNTGRNPHDIVLSDPKKLEGFGISLEKFVPGTSYEFAFDLPGEYRYYCSIHGTQKGGGMAGTIVVK